MNSSRTFKTSDKVFAKMKGYSPWPAIILEKSGKKFKVQFYGSGQIGYVTPDNIFYYLKNREQFTKGTKKKEFKNAIKEIENAIAQSGTDGDNSSQAKNVPKPKRKRGDSRKSSVPVPTKVVLSSESEDSNSISDNIVSSGSRLEDNARFVDPDAVETNAEVDEDLSFLPKIAVVAEFELKNWIIYADTVKEKPELYKAHPVENRSHSEGQVFPVLLPSGQYAGLKLHRTWPLHFSDEYECALYDSNIASTVLILKDVISKGEITPETNPELFLEDFDLSANEIRRDIQTKLLKSKCERLERFRAESTLIELEEKVKDCLTLTKKANPKKAAEFLNSMLKIEFNEIMLKKHSHVVDTIMVLTNYVGNVERWKLTPAEHKVFIKNAQEVRKKAGAIYSKFESVVTFPFVTNFWDDFNEVANKLREDSAHLNTEEFYGLCAEPYTRAAIIDQLEQKQGLIDDDKLF